MHINLMITKWLSGFNFNHAYAFLFGLLGAMVIIFLTHMMAPKERQIATVNITQIIKQFTQAEAKKMMTDETLKRETKAFGRHLEETLKKFAETHHLILVPTEAVIAGCEDVTRLITLKLMEK